MNYYGQFPSLQTLLWSIGEPKYLKEFLINPPPHQKDNRKMPLLLYQNINRLPILPLMQTSLILINAELQVKGPNLNPRLNPCHGPANNDPALCLLVVNVLDDHSSRPLDK